MTDEEADYLADSGPSVGFEYPADEAAGVLEILTGLIAWAGSSRARHAALPVLLRQRKATHGELAREVVCSRQAIQKAMKEGRAELVRLSRRASI